MLNPFESGDNKGNGIWINGLALDDVSTGYLNLYLEEGGGGTLNAVLESDTSLDIQSGSALNQTADGIYLNATDEIELNNYTLLKPHTNSNTFYKIISAPAMHPSKEVGVDYWGFFSIHRDGLAPYWRLMVAGAEAEVSVYIDLPYKCNISNITGYVRSANAGLGSVGTMSLEVYDCNLSDHLYVLKGGAVTTPGTTVTTDATISVDLDYDIDQSSGTYPVVSFYTEATNQLFWDIFAIKIRYHLLDTTGLVP